ncbi:MAG TPA: GNAT family N-acetyltransferase [Vicinamibacterales bacterium]|jgi:GNAT superfamily N-acetyltransferase
MTDRVRTATLDDLRVLVHHRVAMFRDMGVPMDAPALEAAFAKWLARMMPAGTYRAWVVEHTNESGARAIVAGGGATILPWPPGPRYSGESLAFVYNVYTEPDHRRRGLAVLVMRAIHDWCRTNGVTSLALNASQDGRALYEQLGYAQSPAPMMFYSLADEDAPPQP